MVSSTAARSWAGTTLADRRAERRRRLLEAGLDLLGTQGAAAVTVRSVCREAKLTDRYFYENFEDRAELLLAVFDGVAGEAATALVTAAESRHGDLGAMANAAVEAFISFLTDDPRKGRVLLVEPLTDLTLGTRGVAIAPMFAQLIQAQVGKPGSSVDASLTATAMVGALANLFIRWMDGSQDVTREHLADYCVRLLLNASALMEE